MAKQNNSLTEFNALEGIYEHLSTIDDLAKEVGAISSRLRKIEEQLKEPMEIADPILNPGHSREYSRDTCIYGALIKSIEACMGLTEQKNVLNDVISQLNKINVILDKFCIKQSRQNDMLIRNVEIVTNTNDSISRIYSVLRTTLVGMTVLILILLLICIFVMFLFK